MKLYDFVDLLMAVVLGAFIGHSSATGAWTWTMAFVIGAIQYNAAMRRRGG